MKFIVKWILSAFVIYLLSRYLNFVRIHDLPTLLIFMLVLSLLNVTVKPLLVIFTIPVTLVTFGLFLIVLNGMMVIVADYFVAQITIGSGMLGAITFSLFISLTHYIIDMIVGD